MAGIYIHVPFCRRNCYYCDFHYSLYLKNKPEYVTALVRELESRTSYLGGEIIESVYFGGGTPSILTISDVERIISTVKKDYNLVKNPEVTFEANPDDVSREYVSALLELGINRLSIGIQSFSNKDLKFLNRVHTSNDALESIKLSKESGCKNINIDLIYGIPGTTIHQWERNLDLAFSLGIQHISAYHLTYEPGTILYHKLQKGKIKAIDEDTSIKQFLIAIKYAKKMKFVHYEISNYGKPGYFSKHNLCYWKYKKYLGIGPSAHSFNGKERRYNVSKNRAYILNVLNNSKYFETEVLDNKNKYNEYVLLGLRTIWGIKLDEIATMFGDEFKDYCIKSVEKYVNDGYVSLNNHNIILTEKGKLIADTITTSLFY